MATSKSTDIVPASEYALMQQTGDISEIVAANLGGSIQAFDLERIKMPAGGGLAWEIPTLEGYDTEKEFEGIIVHWNEPRAYWEKSLDDADSGGGTPPDCRSLDSELGEGMFGPGSEHNPTGHCDRCPMSQWGSKGDGSNGQACKQMRTLFMVTNDAVLPYAVVLPPTSIKPARQYMLKLASRAMPFYGVITKIGLEKAQNPNGIKYSKATFSVGKVLDPEEAQQVKAFSETMKAVLDASTGDLIDATGQEMADA